MYVGVDYYPEHWERKRWDIDAALMKKAGFNVVRLAEFAWINMEPREQQFEFGWLDEALEILGKNGISAILGTPTAVMPAWVAKKYPETLLLQKDGTRIAWGVRKNNCFSSETYRLLSKKITRAMAEHFSGNPNVIGWQTDNEFGSPSCLCDSCRLEFHAWLEKRYGDIGSLNKAWGNHFWGHLFSDWSEIPIPVDQGVHNPGACLDWKRFNSWLNVRFQKEQLDILRVLCPDHFVTHNFMGLFKDLDYYDLAEDLDFVSWDNYPCWGKPEVRFDASFAADVMRGLKKKNFWIMEQTAGPGGWGAFGRNPHPGEIRNISYQQLAHGADGQIWFRWRTCTAGREQYWHGLLGHDGRPLRRYDEAALTAREYHRLEKEIKDTTVVADVAVIYDYESIWALDIQAGYGGNTFQNAVKRYYNALFRSGTNVDMIRPSDDFSRYKIVIAADLNILEDDVADRLNEFVRKGGILLADCRTGVKDISGLCHARTLPGKLSESLGIEIEEYESIPDDMHFDISGTGGISGSFTSVSYADWVKPLGAKPLAGYRQWHMEKFSAVTRNRYGKGSGWYVGTVVKEEGFYDQLIKNLLDEAGLKQSIIPPAGVEVSIRRGKKKIAFIINHTEEVKTVAVPSGKLELLSGKKTRKKLELGRYGVAVLKL